MGKKLYPVSKAGKGIERSKWLERGWIAYLKFLQTSLSKWVSKTNGEAILALAQLSYASHLYKLIQG